ncbi:impB/mucB/samB family protein [Mycobacterium xenopi 4042]|uniref:ImpB/mucB/samB family protein n=1 Tax=Mycobacterium xenopi 4042 TaxID=1299334 RepID=X7YQU5_MYCXE|nr:impB/mucB/samB family protein [Mycobacterium xenopi 4042]
MDAFFASVEQLTRPTLRGRPVLVGGLGGRGVVAGASYEARTFGARSAMPMHQARRLVGIHAVVLPPRGVVYGVASRRVFDTVRAAVAVVEQLSYDEGFAEPPSSPAPRSSTSSGSARTCGDGCARRPALSPRSAPGRASRSPRSLPGWPNPTACG